MTQQSVYNLLKKKDKWMTAKEIEEGLDINYGSVISSLNRLLKHREILRKDDHRKKFNGSGFIPYFWKSK